MQSLSQKMNPWFLSQQFNKYLNRPVTSTQLDLFRICFFSILLLEALQILMMKEFYFAELGLHEGIRDIALFAWIGSIICIIIGLPFASFYKIINYLLTVYILGDTASDLEYHMDYAWLGCSFLAIFIPLNYKYSAEFIFKSRQVARSVPQYYYLTFLFVPVALIYFDSIFFKLSSPMWRNLLGLWLPASLPPAAQMDLSLLLDQKLIVLAASLITLLFETVFIFMFWFRKFRFILFIFGGALHLGILIAFPIPLFALGYCSLYLLMLYKPLNDQEVKLGHRISPFAKATLISFSSFCLFYQFFLIGLAPGFDFFGLKNTKYLHTISPLMKDFFGVTHHSVFMHTHFQTYNKQIKATFTDSLGNEIDLTNDGDGLPLHNISTQGRFWVFWAFRVNSPIQTVREESFDKMQRYVRFLLEKSNLCFEQCTVSIYGRDLKFEPVYEKGMLGNLKKSPWKLERKLTF